MRSYSSPLPIRSTRPPLPEPLPDVTGMDCRYCWTGTFPNRQALHIPTIIRYISTQRTRTQSFPTRFLRSQSLTGLTGHEVGHLLYSDFTAHAVHLRSLENGSFYPKEPELSLPAYQTALEEIKEVLEEKDKAGCLTLARCAATFQNILEDIHIEDRMCEEFHGTFRQGIELNNLRMSEQIPSIQEQIDKEYQPFSIIANLILSYCRTGNINNPTGYQGDYLDTISDCTDLLDTAMESEKGTDRMLVSNALLALTWNYIQPLIEKTREELEMHGEDSAADALEDLLGD